MVFLSSSFDAAALPVNNYSLLQPSLQQQTFFPSVKHFPSLNLFLSFLFILTELTRPAIHHPFYPLEICNESLKVEPNDESTALSFSIWCPLNVLPYLTFPPFFLFYFLVVSHQVQYIPLIKGLYMYKTNTEGYRVSELHRCPQDTQATFKQG